MVNINEKFGKILSISSQDIEQKQKNKFKILTLVMCHNSVTNVQNLMCNKPKLDLVNINAYTKFGKIIVSTFFSRYWAEMKL